MKKSKENIVKDFQEYLQENNIEISKHEILNEIYINNYLESIFCNSYDEESQKEQERIFKIIDKYCFNCTINL